MKNLRYSTWLLRVLLGGLLALPAIAEEEPKPVMISFELKSFSMIHYFRGGMQNWQSLGLTVVSP
jgi:hypothetical protein